MHAAATLQRNLTAVAEAFLANTQADLVSSAAAGEDQVTAMIDHCISYHRGKACKADPHACPEVFAATVAADAATEMVAAWLIATGTYTADADNAALEAAADLIAAAVATAEADRLTQPSRTESS